VRLARFLAIPLLAFALGACAQKTPQHAAAARDALTASGVVFAPVAADSIARVIRAAGGRATVVNVWASWCEPCREEFPEIVRLARTYRAQGLRVVFVSADFKEAYPEARKYLAQQGVDWPTYYKTGGDQEFIAALDDRWTGALPGTFVYDAQGKLRDFWEGKASYDRFEASVKPLLSATTRKEDAS
jgi:thiol-disulfide isomerase/thioredoxin